MDPATAEQIQLKRFMDRPLGQVEPGDLLVLFVIALVHGYIEDANRMLIEILDRDPAVIRALIESDKFISFCLKRLGLGRAECELFLSETKTELFEALYRERCVYYHDSFSRKNLSKVRCNYASNSQLDWSQTIVSADIFVRNYWWPGRPQTRVHEMFWRLPAVFGRGGWAVDTFPADLPESVVGWVAEKNTKKDVVLIDLQIGHWTDQDHRRVAQQVSEKYKFVIGLLLDPWAACQESISKLWGDTIDLIWAPGSSNVQLESWRARGYMTSNFLLPLGLNFEKPPSSRSPLKNTQFKFSGSIEWTNFPRMFWRIACRNNKRVLFDISSLADDRRSPQDSYLAYLERLTSTGAAINFSMRRSGSRMMTGRTYESLAAGVLLLQEYSPDVAEFFVPNEHYIEFDGLESFETHVETTSLSAQKLFREVAREGCAFFHDTYSDKHLTAHFKSFL